MACAVLAYGAEQLPHDLGVSMTTDHKEIGALRGIDEDRGGVPLDHTFSNCERSVLAEDTPDCLSELLARLLNRIHPWWPRRRGTPHIRKSPCHDGRERGTDSHGLVSR